MRIPAQRLVILATAVGALTVATAAWAGGFGGTSVATATGRTASVAELSASLTVNGELFPGQRLTATARVDNPNEFAVRHVRVVELAVTATEPGCDTDGSAVTARVSGSPTLTAGATGQRVGIVVDMGDDAIRACAGSALAIQIRLIGDVAAHAPS
jgi:hypothetical protein